MLRPTSSPSSRALISSLRQQTLSSSRSRTVFPNKLPINSRFASTSSASRKSASWSGRLVRWGLAGGAVYWYNTSPLFAEEQAYPNLAPDALRQDPNGPVHTLESLTAERQKLKEMKEKEAKLSAPPTPSIAATDELSTSVSEGAAPPPLGSETPTSDPAALADEADQQGAFNPETGEINWDCPCLGGMAHGPCGENFREAFSCFVYSKEEPKGMDCIDKFKGMQECFREHPDIYGAELEGDDDEEEGGDRIERAENEGDKPEAALSKDEHSQSSKSDTHAPAAPLESPGETEKAK